MLTNTLNYKNILILFFTTATEQRCREVFKCFSNHQAIHKLPTIDPYFPNNLFDFRINTEKLYGLNILLDLSLQYPLLNQENIFF